MKRFYVPLSDNLLLSYFWNKVSSSPCRTWTCFAVNDYTGILWSSRLLNARSIGVDYKCQVLCGAGGQAERAACMLSRHSDDWATSPDLQLGQLTLLLPFLRHFLLPMQGDRQYNQQKEGGSLPIPLTITSINQSHVHDKLDCYNRLVLLGYTPLPRACQRIYSLKLVETEAQGGHLKVKSWWACHREIGPPTIKPQSHSPPITPIRATLLIKWWSTGPNNILSISFKVTGNLRKASNNSKPGPLYRFFLQ